MFIPIRTDRRLRHTPWVNYSLVALNVIIFLMTRNDIQEIAYVLYQASRGVIAPPIYEVLIEQLPVYSYYLQPRHLELRSANCCR